MKTHLLLISMLCASALAERIPGTPWKTTESNRSWFTPTSPQLLWGGRTLATDTAVLFDWPGIYLRAQFEGTSCAVVFRGEALYDVLVDGDSAGIIRSTAIPTRFVVAEGLTPGKHKLRISKRSESQTETQAFLGLDLDSGSTLLPEKQNSQRRILFIGDSYTVGFGNEAKSRDPDPGTEDSLVLTTTNTSAAFPVLVARSLAADYQILAFSGRGLVRNINGIEPGKEIPWLLSKTLIAPTSNSAPAWKDSSWHPQVAVIGIGINDWQGNQPYPDTTQFDKAYATLLSRLRQAHPGIRFILCATHVWPTDVLIPRVQAIVSKERAMGHTDVEYFEYGAERTGLYWHPNLPDHQEIARKLRPLVGKIGGWQSR